MLVSVMSSSVLAADVGQTGAAEGQYSAETVDFDSIDSSLEIDWTQAAQLPLTGYFTKNIIGENVGEGRTVKVYIAPEASIRSYFTVVAVPSGVDTQEFLEKQGWFDLANEKGEGLFVLEPGADGWGSLEEEAAYMEAAIKFLKTGKNDNGDGVGVFSTFGEFYLVGYGDGAAPLELWAAQNPLFVISQVYVDGTTVGDEALDEASAKAYDGSNTGGYPAVPDFEASLKTAGMSPITNLRVAVPTWLAGGYDDENDPSVRHWTKVNDCFLEADSEGVYHQDKDSDLPQTAHANAQLPEDAEYGISQVKVGGTAEDAQAIYDFLSIYTRYDNTFAYSNALAYRLDYTEARVGAQQQAAKGEVLGTLNATDYQGKAQPVDILGRDSVELDGHGTVEVGVFAFSDNSGDGENDPREYMVYVPQGFDGEKLPVLFVYPGNTQTDGIFFDCTQWYQLADREGIVLVMVTETYSGPVAVTHKDAVYYQTAMMQILRENTDGKFYGVNLDFDRVYGTGQSLGSMTTQSFARAVPEFYAAVASTSGVMDMGFEDSNQPIPTFLMVGESDLAFLVGDLDKCENLADWANYFLRVNGLNTTVGTKEDNYGASSYSLEDGRYNVYTWNNEQNIPVFQWDQTLLRSHNCYPGEMQLMWDYLKNFSKSNETGVRYYKDTEISFPTPVTDIDTVKTADIDYSVSARIPLEGWYEKTMEDGRSVKMYFPEYAACRAYFTVVAAPNGVEDTAAWAAQQGYTQLMEERGEVLVILEAAEGGWKDLATEAAYVTDAMNFVNAGKNADGVALFTNYSTFYLVGYGEGSAALEAWAADHPILVGSQAYINGTGAGAEYLAEVGAKIYDGTNTGGYDPGIADLNEFEKVLGEHGYEAKAITRSEVPVPTLFAGEYKTSDPSVAYWMSANDCLDTAEAGVYWQAKDSNAFQTEYANDCTGENHGISQVKLTGGDVTVEELADFLYGYSRYNVPFAYSNHLSERQDYTAVRVAAQAATKSLKDVELVKYAAPVTSDAGEEYEGYYVLAREQGTVGEGTVESGIVAYSDDNGDGTLDAREYLMYIPNSAKGKDAPIVFQFPGMTQSVAVGFDSTQWWQVANNEGVIIVIMGEAYNNGVALSWKNSDMGYRAVRDILEKDSSIQIDWTRCYGSGHSLGSNQVQDFVHTHPDFFAAVGSTSFGSRAEGGEYVAVPTMLVNGQSDLPFLMPDLWGSDSLKSWFGYLAEANNLKVAEATKDNADAKVEGTARTYTYTWNNKQDIPMVVWGQTYMREHNCYPAEVPMAWDFISHYSLSANGDRAYSPSAFAANDAVKINPTVRPIERADVAQQIYDFFNWSHRDEYNDIWAPDMTHFSDVAEGSRNWMAIECLLQQGVVDAAGEYRPDAGLTYGEAIDMLSNAFGVAKEEIAAMMAEGYNANSPIHSAEWQKVFKAMTENYVSPVQALPIANSESIAPRRYIKLWTPTDGATIYVSKSVSRDTEQEYYEDFELDIENAVDNVDDWSKVDFSNGTKDDPTDDLMYVTKPTQIYTVDEDGYIKEDYAAYPDTYVTYKVVAVKDGVKSAERTYKWHLQRPTDADQERGDYQYTLIHEKTATQPAVYQICRDAESLRPMAWYVEGQDSGVVVDALFTSVSTQWNMKEFVDEHLATKPYILVVGHAHPDHDAQVANFVDAGIPTYCSDRGWKSLSGLLTVKDKDGNVLAEETAARQALVKDIKEGDSFELGNCTLDVYALPGHDDSLVMLADRANGLVFATDIYGCTRAGSADNVSVSGIPADLLLSLAQQSHADYERNGVQVQEVYTGHDELPLDHNVLVNFEKALQQVIDNGDAATTYTLRGGNNKMYSRTTMVGDMWKDGTNWLSLMLGGIKGDETAYLSSGDKPYMAATEADKAINSELNYNFVDGVQQYKRYSVLSNVEVENGELEGVDLTWKAPADITWAGEETTVNYTLHDKFNPWHYEYTINVPAESKTISIDATTMSTKAAVTGITLNGEAQADLTDLAVADGDEIVVKITAQDGVTTSTYTFNVDKASSGGSGSGSTGADKDDAEKLPFTDVNGADWFYAAVEYVYGKGLMDGVSASEFAPNQALTRAMVAQILYALEGTPSVSGGKFDDVAAGKWYTNAVNWAAEQGLVSGYGAGKFGPEDLVTREQLAVILNQYAQYKKMNAEAKGSLAAFGDADSASSWAVEALTWAVDNGIISGMGANTLASKGTTTRAQMAQMLMKFLEK